MKKLKIILRSKLFLIVLLFFSLFRIITYSNKSILNINDTKFYCVVLSKSQHNNVILDCSEKVIANIDGDIKIGDILQIKGYLEELEGNRNFNLFNYKYYQNNNSIFYRLKIISYEKKGITNDLVLNIKRFISYRIDSLKSSNYLNAFILGDKSNIDTDSLKRMGIIHLFSVSGMHISLLISLFEKGISNNKRKQYVTIASLYLYYLLINSVSILRCLIFLIVKRINKNLDLRIHKYTEILISIILIILIKPNAIYNIGFYYSIILSVGISLFNYKCKINNKILKSILLSIFIFILSFPLNIYTSFEINLLSIIYNLIFIPFVSIILFSLSLLAFVFPFLDSILLLFTNIFDYLINYFNKIDIMLIFIKPSIIILVFYYIIIFLSLYNYKVIFLFLLMIIIHFNYNIFFQSKYVLTLDVGQGDSILIHLNNSNLLIDTGGSIYKDISNNILIPVLKSYGIRSIDYLITTHGDFDHMGEAINLVENYKVEKVIFNCGEFNDLEKDLIKVLVKKNIPYYSCIKELSIDNNKLYFLQTKEYDNENDNSNIIYTEINGYKFMLMGDAGLEKEKDILEKYNISNVDVLKVGHHGSKTSSSEEFINEINPKYSIISVGKNNRYGHPNKEVLNNLEQSKIYRTDQDGSIMFNIKNNKLDIEICMP